MGTVEACLADADAAICLLQRLQVRVGREERGWKLRGLIDALVPAVLRMPAPGAAFPIVRAARSCIPPTRPPLEGATPRRPSGCRRRWQPPRRA
jgi:hypothetical protein